MHHNSIAHHRWADDKRHELGWDSTLLLNAGDDFIGTVGVRISDVLALLAHQHENGRSSHGICTPVPPSQSPLLAPFPRNLPVASHFFSFIHPPIRSPTTTTIASPTRPSTLPPN